MLSRNPDVAHVLTAGCIDQMRDRIEAGRKTEKQQEPAPLPVKIELFYQAPTSLVPPVRCGQMLVAAAAVHSTRLWLPPLPPPRGC